MFWSGRPPRAGAELHDHRARRAAGRRVTWSGSWSPPGAMRAAVTCSYLVGVVHWRLSLSVL